MNKNYLIVFILVVASFLFYYKKDTFESIKEQPFFTNQHQPAKENDSIITKSYLKTLLTEHSNYSNGPPSGANITTGQNKYDLIFKDIIVASEKRNQEKYPNPNNYCINLNINLNKIYKAELIEVYVPAATDDLVNIPTSANRLYFGYQNGTNNTMGYVVIQSGTYQNPATIANELNRQFNIVLSSAGFTLSRTVGVVVSYDRNLNRYIFADRNFSSIGTLVIFPENGYALPLSTLVVTNSMTELLLLNYSGPTIYPPYVSGPKKINSSNNILYVDYASSGDHGDSSGGSIPLTNDVVFSNSIISEVVLTCSKLFLSLGKLNGDTCSVIPDENGSNNVPDIFCQVPNNTGVGSSSVKTLLNQPSVYSSIQFYNPPISKLQRLDVKWYSEDGNLLRILDHCFTIRIYYFQKRFDTSDFSIPVI